MRKETINTFSDGMSLDLNPLGTPAKTLTNCLNGTLITYNGNELTLQNDMGNVPVGTAQLPHGYVPVGMKEYGGIIYVASYNPETGKGQLGCFPSPQQIYTSEAAQTVLNINLQKIFVDLYTNSGIPIINFNEFKTEIFKDTITEEPRIFTSGDTFIIKVEDNLSSLFRQAIDENIITLKLCVIPINGNDIIDLSDCNNNYLKLYKDKSEYKDLWIFQNSGTIYEDIDKKLPFETIINEYRQYLQSYPPNIGQGTLEVIIEFNTFKLFNLYKNIVKENDSYKVQFIGQGETDDLDECNPVNEASLIQMILVGQIDNSSNHNIYDFKEIQSSSSSNSLEAETLFNTITPNQTLYYDILPGTKWGVLTSSFLKSGQLSYEFINSNQNKIVNWNFEINKSEALIKWSYIYINNSSKEVDHMRFVCIPLDQVLDENGDGKQKNIIDKMYVSGSTTYNGQYIYKIKKPYYSGDFEDVFPIDDTHLEKEYIYLCRLDIIYTNGQVENANDYKLLYTGTFFNDKNIQDFNYTNRPEIEINVDIQVQQKNLELSTDYTVLNETKSPETKDEVSANDVMFLADEALENNLVGIVINKEYNVQSELNIVSPDNVTYQNKNYKLHPTFAGNLEEENLLDKFSQQNNLQFNITSTTNYLYNDIGDSLIEQYKHNYIELEELNSQPITNQTITFTKNSSNK